MLTGIHFLLTYMCNLKCDHCFLYAGSNAKGTFTLNQIQKVLDEAAKMGTIEWVYFEGGEPFLYYPLMLEGIKIARGMGFKVGIVTNGYYATSEEDAELWLRPLVQLEIADLSISDDSFHWGEEKDNPGKRALAAAKRLGLPASSISIGKPTFECIDKGRGRGTPIISGGSKFRGRAIEKLVEGLPQKYWGEFTDCPYENLEEPERVHIDPYGNIHLCQGLSMGNIWETPLSTIIKNYTAGSHPICGPLASGGPALLAKEYNIKHEGKYVDECHFCYILRLALIDRFPQYLAPRQVYGLE